MPVFPAPRFYPHRMPQRLPLCWCLQRRTGIITGMPNTPSVNAGFSVEVSSGLLQQARQVPSPNHDARPDGMQASLLIVHGISLPPDEFGGPYIDQLFSNQLDWNAHPYFKQIEGMRVSSHLLIRRDGEVVQYVPFHRRAWHAGVSSYQGRERCNDFSIGIELEGADHLPYEAAQYRQLARVILALCRAYSELSLQHLVGHSDVAPGRKTDPGESFDWPRLRAMLTAFAAMGAA